MNGEIKKEKTAKSKIDRKKVKSTTVDMMFLLIACCFGTFSTVSIMLPNGLTSGGLTGIVRIIQNYVNLNFSVIYYMASIAILIILTIFLGWKEARKTIILSIMYPTVMIIFEKLDLSLLEKNDILLAAVFCGVFSGISSGIVIWRGYCFSGTDGIAKILRKRLFPQIPQGKIMVSIDAAVIIISAFIFGRNIALYALITQLIISKTIDTVIFGFESKIVQVEIITKEMAEQIIDFVMDDMHRGVTTEKVIGEYTKERYTKIRVYCSPRESIELKKKLAETDPSAFVSSIRVENVWANGKGFKDINEDK